MPIIFSRKSTGLAYSFGYSHKIQFELFCKMMTRFQTFSKVSFPGYRQVENFFGAIRPILDCFWILLHNNPWTNPLGVNFCFFFPFCELIV